MDVRFRPATDEELCPVCKKHVYPLLLCTCSKETKKKVPPKSVKKTKKEVPSKLVKKTKKEVPFRSAYEELCPECGKNTKPLFLCICDKETKKE